jgi:hypothetical protein
MLVFRYYSEILETILIIISGRIRYRAYIRFLFITHLIYVYTALSSTY